METLTQKELAPYLPYGLKLRIEIFGDNKTIVQLEGINNYQVELSGIRQTVTEFFDYENVKPILYPLDYLTKPITHNGETFVPIIKLVDPDNNNNDWSKMEVKVYNPFPNIKMHRNYYKVTHNELGELLVINPKNISVLPYNIIQYLLEWRFDVFNLINRGLAIPITETFNPYK